MSEGIIWTFFVGTVFFNSKFLFLFWSKTGSLQDSFLKLISVVYFY